MGKENTVYVLQKDLPKEIAEPEVWIPVAMYKDKYLVSSYGNVISVNYNRKGRERRLIPQKDKDGYLLITLCNEGKPKTFKLSRLVGYHFIPNPLSLPEINHIYGDKTDNYYKHLEWSSRRDNILHSFRTGLRPNTTEKQRAAVRATNIKKRKTVYQYTTNKVFMKKYDSLTDASVKNGIDLANISSCCRGIVKSAGGYFWSYLKIVNNGK